MDSGGPAGALRRLGANLARLARQVAIRSALPRDGGAWLLVKVAHPLEDLSAPRLPFGPAPRLGLLDLLATLERASRDPAIAGVLLRFTAPLPGMSRALSLRRAVDRLRERGKPVVAYADGYEAGSLIAASGASRVFLPESGSVMLVGLRLESLHWKRLLEKLHVRPEVVRVGSHKTAGERFTRERMSPEEREQLEELADDFFEALVGAVGAGRELSAERVRTLVDGGPYSARAAVEAGLVDACLYPDEVEEELFSLAPGTAREPREGAPRLVDAALYHRLRAADAGWRPLLRDLPRIAVVVAGGGIHRGGGPRGISAEHVRETLDSLRREPAVRGVVLRLESPGGDAVASDLLWRAVRLVGREKPVVVSMGDVVASGGYYIAAAADAVFAEAASVTGSIGVVGGKVDLAGLYGRLGVSKDAVERGERAGLLSDVRGFTGDERAALQALFESAQATFADRVAQGRGLAPEGLARVAQGRIWSGSRARALGLVDAIGGPREALGEVRRRAGLGDRERYLVELHPRAPQLPSLLGLLRRLPGMAAW